MKLRELAADVGARWHELAADDVTRVIREADPLGIDVHVIALRRTAPGPAAGAGR